MMLTLQPNIESHLVAILESVSDPEIPVLTVLDLGVIREAKEELGYHVSNVKAVSTVFLSPGIVRERVHLFVGSYTDTDKINNGGGLEVEGEEIEVLELSFSEALQMISL